MDIRTAELKKLLLIALLFFGVVFSLTVLKPARNSIFLSDLGAAKLPFVYLITAAATGIFVFINTRISNKLSSAAFISATFAFLGLNLLAFWWLIRLSENWITMTFYVWVNIFNTAIVGHFWAFANDFFNPREAKKLIGFILTGGTLGGIAGGLAADISVSELFTTEDVLLLALFALVVCIALIQIVDRKIPRARRSQTTIEEQARHAQQPERPTEKWHQNRHLRLLALMTALATIVSTLIDYQFNAVVETTYASKAAKTRFFGQFYVVMNIVSLFLQLFLTGKILRRFGIGVTLIILPITLGLGSLGFMLVPTILLAAFLKIGDKALQYSLSQSSNELLYLPIPSQIRRKAKLIIDVFIHRFASGLAACLILVFGLVLSANVAQLSVITVVILAFALVVIRMLSQEYINSLRKLISRQELDLEQRLVRMLDSKSIDMLMEQLHSDDEQKVRYALSLLELAPSGHQVEKLLPLLGHADATIRAQALRILTAAGGPKHAKHVEPLLLDESISVRLEAIHFLCAHGDSLPMKKMSEFLAESDPKIKSSALACMINHSGKITDEGMSVLEEMLTDRSNQGVRQREEAARVLGNIGHGFRLHENLVDLLHDPAVSVQLVAIESAGKARHDEFIEPLMTKLRNAKLRSAARAALANYGDRILPLLKSVMSDTRRDFRVRKSIPRILFQMKSKASIQTLEQYLDLPDAHIRYEVIKALNKYRQQDPDLRIDSENVRKTLLREIRDYYHKLNIFYTYARRETLSLEIREVDDILYPALQEKLQDGLERIFRLLALRYSQEDIYSAYYRINRGDKDDQANAVEFLDNLLPGAMTKLVLPIVDESRLTEKVRHGQEMFDLSRLSRKQAFSALLDDDDRWLRVCTIYRLAREGITDFSNRIRPYINSEEPLLREIAQRYFHFLKKAEALQMPV